MQVIEKLKNYEIILGSASPRRKELLSEMGISFRVEVRSGEEIFPETLDIDEVAGYLSREKSKLFEITGIGENQLVITADTIVVVEDRILGKPANTEEAKKILRLLSGKVHRVITGVTLLTRKKSHTFSVSTDVFFKQLSEEEIGYYVTHYQPMDKAGAYGIQEWIGHVAIEGINGSYFNVMGLPTHRLWEELSVF
ncbi:MAG: Maf family nucleotide pyrophosphatase [Bacteroidales bacterium]|nr:Maf family nucleotide pyrophosphatase [Bacteroidales bacterium]